MEHTKKKKITEMFFLNIQHKKTQETIGILEADRLDINIHPISPG